MQDIDVDMLQECLDDCPNGKRTKENMKALAGLLYKYAIPRHQSEMNLAEYLNCKAIFACGGSWMVPGDMITDGKFDEIEKLTAEAVELLKEIRG
mgnify:CR=1 FL=1